MKQSFDVLNHRTSSTFARSAPILTLTVVMGLTSCASDEAARQKEPAKPVAEQVADEQPPAGIGKKDDAKLLGPYETPSALTVQGYKSSEANGTVNSWLLMGQTDAALIDAQLVLSEGEHVVEMIKASGKTLKWVWITHGHPDHSTGLVKVVEAFPEAQILAHPKVAANAGALFEKYKAPLNRFFPGDIPEGPVELQAHDSNTLELEGVSIDILTFDEGESDFTTALVIPEAKAVFCADMVYHQVFPWLNEMRIDGVRAHVDAVEAMDNVETIYPGHGEPMGKDYLDTYRAYLDFFMNEIPKAKDSNDLVARVWRQYRDWRSLAGLRFSAGAYIGARDKAGE